MEKAFDVIYQTEIDAVTVANNYYGDYGEQFRYKCLCCGEDVYLAAAESKAMVPHFRHRRGNNDTDCEKYLGQPGALEHYLSLRKSSQDNVDFFLNIDRWTFEIGVSFGEEEILKGEEEERSLNVYVTYSEPSISIPICRENFVVNEKNYITISDISSKYWVSFDSGISRVVYQDSLFKTNGVMSVFRETKHDEHLPLQTSGLLYSNTNYYFVTDNEETIREVGALLHSTDRFSFFTGGLTFYGIRAIIEKIEPTIKRFFAHNGYQLETSEFASILWPPVYVKDKEYICDKDTVYFHSSFPFIPNGNVSAGGSTGTSSLGEGLYSVGLEERISIREKNVDMLIKHEQEKYESQCEEPEVIFAEKYLISDSLDYYMFDKNGCTRLSAGIHAYLSETDKIVGYKNGHVKVRIYGCPKQDEDPAQIIDDVLKYHPLAEPFNPDEFMETDLDDAVLAYLEECYRKGSINSVIRRYIKEGLI